MEPHDQESPSSDNGIDGCVRCGQRASVPGHELCTPCTVSVRVELSGGLARLERYLARWAAFDVWLTERGLGSAVA
jgi:hypothetical protein